MTREEASFSLIALRGVKLAEQRCSVATRLLVNSTAAEDGTAFAGDILLVSLIGQRASRSY